MPKPKIINPKKFGARTLLVKWGVELGNLDDRLKLIVTSAFIEWMVKEALKANLKYGPQLVSKIGYEAQIIVAHELKIFSDVTCRNLQTLRLLRDAVAHEVFHKIDKTDLAKFEVECEKVDGNDVCVEVDTVENLLFSLVAMVWRCHRSFYEALIP